MIFMQTVLMTGNLLQESALVCECVGVSGLAAMRTLGWGVYLEVRGDNHHGTLDGDGVGLWSGI